MTLRTAAAAGLLSVLLFPDARAQLALSGVKNSGKTIFSKGAADLMVNGPGGWAYRGSNGGVFHHDGPATATLTVNGVYDAFSYSPLNPGKDYFNGAGGAASVAEIAGTTAPLFGELYLANGDTFRVVNAQGIRVGKTLHFSNTITKTLRSNAATGAIVFQTGASFVQSLSQSDAQYVDGYITKEGATAFTFPVGDQDGADIRPLSVSATTAPTNAVSVAYWKGDPSQPLDPTGGAHDRLSMDTAGTTGSSKLTAVSPAGFWDFIAVNGTEAITVTVSIPDVSGTAGFTAGADLRLVGWNTVAGHWENLSGSIGASAATEGATLTGTLSDMSAYSALGIGTVGTVQPLSLQLVSFGAATEGCQPLLRWQSASETGVQTYRVEYAADGAAFKTMGELAAMNSALGHSYQYQVAGLPDGPAFFRIKALERSGEIHYSATVRVIVDCGQAAAYIAPNPAQEYLTIQGIEASRDGVTVRILDAMGRQVTRAEEVRPGQRIDIRQLPAGAYWVRVAGARSDLFSGKLIKR